MVADVAGNINGVFCEVLAQFAFMFAEPCCRDELPRGASDFVRAEVKFAGPLTGSMGLVVPLEMCAEIAANALGVERTDEEVQAASLDALRELANLTCCHLLSSLAGEKAVFDVSVGRSKDFDQQQWTLARNADDTYTFLADEGYSVLVTFTATPAA